MMVPCGLAWTNGEIDGAAELPFIFRGFVRKTRVPKKSVKVPKAAFDKVLGKLIKTKPTKRGNKASG
jgi:hypothetical protein